jgi:hypothetical protein
MHEGLGYPLYFIPFIGVAKILGVAAMLIPGYPRVKEWAYAGLLFDLSGATYSIITSGQPAANWIFMVLPLGVGVCAYIFYRKKSKISLVPAKPNYYREENIKMEEVKIA